MTDDWVDPRDRKFFAELARAVELLREEKLSPMSHISDESNEESAIETDSRISTLGKVAIAGSTIAGLAGLLLFFRDRLKKRDSKK